MQWGSDYIKCNEIFISLNYSKHSRRGEEKREKVIKLNRRKRRRKSVQSCSRTNSSGSQLLTSTPTYTGHTGQGNVLPSISFGLFYFNSISFHFLWLLHIFSCYFIVRDWKWITMFSGKHQLRNLHLLVLLLQWRMVMIMMILSVAVQQCFIYKQENRKRFMSR